MDDVELQAIRAVARDHGMTVSEWVRVTLRDARRRVSSGGDADRKLAAIRLADRHAFPTADIDEMSAEIERGYETGL